MERAAGLAAARSISQGLYYHPCTAGVKWERLRVVDHLRNSSEVRGNQFHPGRSLHNEVAELERGDNNQRADGEDGVETTVPKGVDRHAQQKA